ncbi:hypothetical protein THAOC_01228, partial [Thalassiosira oceanica]
MTNAASDVELELPGSGDGGRTGRFISRQELQERPLRKAKIVKCGCLVAVAGVSATLGSWASVERGLRGQRIRSKAREVRRLALDWARGREPPEPPAPS